MTAYEFRISDWSSDVCSSDLSRRPGGLFLRIAEGDDTADACGVVAVAAARCRCGGTASGGTAAARPAAGRWERHRFGRAEIGRASRRERVWQAVESLVVDVAYKKKEQKNHSRYTDSQT